ncbi:hypothetical protein Tco_0966987 [Tanacetum coccineum]
MADYSQKWHDGTSTRSRSSNTSDGLAVIQAELNNLGREIKKVNERVYAAQVWCELCNGLHYSKDFPLKEEGKTLEEAYYTKFIDPLHGLGVHGVAVLVAFEARVCDGWCMVLPRLLLWADVFGFYTWDSPTSLGLFTNCLFGISTSMADLGVVSALV